MRTHHVDSPTPSSTIKVGEYHHSTDTQHTVVDVQWHPLSKDQTHLVVLSSDGCLRTYNLATNPKDPESAYHFNPELATAALAERKERRMSSSLSSLTSSLSLTPRKRNTGTFGVDSTMELEASAFCFGRDDGAWGRLTIWGLMTNGEVYTLCPVLPSHALVPKDMLAGLYRTTGSSVDSSFDNDGDDDDLQSPSRMAFLDMLESRGSPLTPKSALLSIAHQPALLDAPFPRGPYRAESALQQEIQDMDDTFTDVAMLGRDGLDVLAVASSNGVVDLYGVFEQMPCWSAAPVAERAVGHKPASAGFMDDSLEEDSFAAELMDSVETGPMLTAFESIDLGRETGNTRLYIGSADDGENATIIYAHHDAGVHAIDASSWMSELSKILGEEGTTNKDLNQRIEQMFPVDENQSGGLWSDVQGIIDTMPYESR